MAGFAYQSVPIDAIPNVGENQVIVLDAVARSFTERHRRPSYLSAQRFAAGRARSRIGSRQEHVRLQLCAGDVQG